MTHRRFVLVYLLRPEQPHETFVNPQRRRVYRKRAKQCGAKRLRVYVTWNAPSPIKSSTLARRAGKSEREVVSEQQYPVSAWHAYLHTNAGGGRADGERGRRIEVDRHPRCYYPLGLVE